MSQLQLNRRVQVYKHIGKNLFSIRQSGKVIGHTSTIILENCKFNVGQAGRQRVLRTGQKNVHATVSGYVTTYYDALLYGDQITYDPYKYEQFYNLDTLEYVRYARFVHLDIVQGVRAINAKP